MTFVYEQEGHQWANDMIQCLLEIKNKKEQAMYDGVSSLSADEIALFEQRYDTIVEEGLKLHTHEFEEEKRKRGKKKQSKGKNLLDRLKKYRRETLAFMLDFSIPFDNNLSEKDIQMAKVKQKISGCFRSEKGEKFFCRIRGYISTVKKHGLNVVKSITDAFKGKPFVPQACAQSG